MKKDAVALTLFLFVLVLAAMLTVGNINAETGTPDKSQAWKNSSLDDIHAVRGVIYDWIKAWQNKDLDSYMSYYSHEFRSEKLDYQGWRSKKASLFKRPGLIFVEMSNLLIFIEEKEAKVSFVQEYTDARLSDVGKKSLLLRFSHGTWKIVSEEWQAIER